MYFVQDTRQTTISGTVIIIMAWLIPFLALLVGIVKWDECPANEWIPVYLVCRLSGGVFLSTSITAFGLPFSLIPRNRHMHCAHINLILKALKTAQFLQVASGVVGVISSSLGLCKQFADSERSKNCFSCLQIPLCPIWILFFVAGKSKNL